MSQVILTPHQQEAYNVIVKFILNPKQPVLVLNGPAGTGKTTLISQLVQGITKIEKTYQLISGNNQFKELQLTATTNPATDVLSRISSKKCRTTQSLFGLKPHKDYTTGESRLIRKASAREVENSLVVIDEPSYINTSFLNQLFMHSNNCKFLFTGDPYQLVDHRTGYAPVFSSGFPTVNLTEIIRQSDPDLKKLVMATREAVINQNYFSFVPDGNTIKVLDRADFNYALGTEFTDPNWSNEKAKYLAWTNDSAIKYNELATSTVTGSPIFKVGDQVINNSYFRFHRGFFRAGETLTITSIKASDDHGLRGKFYGLNHLTTAFMPDSHQEKRKLEDKYRTNNDLMHLKQLDNDWIDLRANYASTVNKAQGSTYENVYIDLHDIARCKNRNQLFRMLYVAVSRASKKVIFTGDLI